MNDLVVVKDKLVKAAIKKYFPRVNLNQPIKRSDLDTLLRGIEWKQIGIGIRKRMKIIKNKKIKPGISVRDNEGNIFIVSKIRQDGFLVLKGQRGGFSPVYLEKI